MAKEDGLIYLFTGDCKGKTTAAIGTAIRALGHGQKVCMIQFMKGTWHYGEIDILEKLDNFELIRGGKGFYKILDDKFPEEEHRKAAEESLKLIEGKISSGDYDLVICDELNVTIDVKLLKVEDVLKVIEKKHPKVNLIITGRGAPKELIKIADLVTEMRQIKHPYEDKGIQARKGLEF